MHSNHDDDDKMVLRNRMEVVPEKFKFDLESLLDFIFPSDLQHPLAAGRLFAFGYYGPLDEQGNIRTGIKGNRILMEYELTQMCVQFEREDIMQIYLHKKTDMGLLNNMEQDMMVSQADAHLKREKGKAMLPRIARKDIQKLFEDNLTIDETGLYSFHEAQQLIFKYREDRIKQYKLIYPSLASTNKSNKNKLPAITSESTTSIYTGDETTLSSNAKKNKHKRVARVSEIVAPATMFQKMKGLSNPDLIAQSTKYLSKHAYKITDIDARASTDVLYNIKLLREIPPNCPNPYENKRDDWNDVCAFKGTGLGSKVNAAASSSTWKRKVTLY